MAEINILRCTVRKSSKKVKTRLSGFRQNLVNYSGKIPNNLFSQYDSISTVSKQEVLK